MTEPTRPEWEEITSNTKRLRVPGGWIYRMSGYDQALAAVFVPDPPVSLIFDSEPKLEFVPTAGVTFLNVPNIWPPK